MTVRPRFSKEVPKCQFCRSLCRYQRSPVKTPALRHGAPVQWRTPQAPSARSAGSEHPPSRAPNECADERCEPERRGRGNVYKGLHGLCPTNLAGTSGGLVCVRPLERGAPASRQRGQSATDQPQCTTGAIDLPGSSAPRAPSRPLFVYLRFNTNFFQLTLISPLQMMMLTLTLLRTKRDLLR